MKSSAADPRMTHRHPATEYTKVEWQIAVGQGAGVGGISELDRTDCGYDWFSSGRVWRGVCRGLFCGSWFIHDHHRHLLLHRRRRRDACQIQISSFTDSLKNSRMGKGSARQTG